MPGADMAAEIAQLRAENARLRAENARLAAELSRYHGGAQLGAGAVQLRLPLDDAQGAAPEVTRNSTVADRISFFRSLFHGRDDVYAVRWEYREGEARRSGYSPAAVDRDHRMRGEYLPLTDLVISRHLVGLLTVGVYPLLPDDTCRFLAVDFDESTWQADAGAYLAACAERGVPAALERSRSGNGGHVWTFFSAPVPAARARRLGEALLTRAMAIESRLSLKSYDRLFPAQDTLPAGGLGNLIALPLQGRAAAQGNAVFVDPQTLRPHGDQWRFLSGCARASLATVEAVVAAAERTGLVPPPLRASLSGADSGDDPWTQPPSGRVPERPIAGPVPARVEMTLSNLAYVERAGLPAALQARAWRLASFANPEFYRRQARRFSTWGIPRVIHCADEFERYIGLPRGLVEATRDLLEAQRIAVDVRDERNPGRPLDVRFHGELTAAQGQAASAALAHDCGVICAPTAFGKTVIGAWLVAARRTSTLVVVHRQPLVDQWRAQLAAFLQLSPKSIGQFGAGRHRMHGHVDVALFQSLVRDGTVQDFVADYGQVIVDECHHVPALSFERVLKEVKARFVVGLTATPVRRDGLHPIVVMQCGPVRFRVDPKDAAAARPFEQVAVMRTTDFRLPPGEEGEVGIQALYRALAGDAARNDQIVTDAASLAAEGRTPLVVTERIDHLELLAARLREQVPHVIVLRGGVGARRRRGAVEALTAVPEGEPCALVATGRYIGEGFDDARPDTLLLTMPVSWWGTVAQYAGRVSRPHPGKREVRIYDYADLGVPMLAAMSRKRRRAYRALGYAMREG